MKLDFLLPLFFNYLGIKPSQFYEPVWLDRGLLCIPFVTFFNLLLPTLWWFGNLGSTNPIHVKVPMQRKTFSGVPCVLFSDQTVEIGSFRKPPDLAFLPEGFSAHSCFVLGWERKWSNLKKLLSRLKSIFQLCSLRMVVGPTASWKLVPLLLYPLSYGEKGRDNCFFPWADSCGTFLPYEPHTIDPFLYLTTSHQD